MTPAEKYNNDAQYRTLVVAIEHQLHEANFTPSEVREAAVLACIHYEQRNAMPLRIIPAEVRQAMKVLQKWRTTSPIAALHQEARA